MRVGLATLLLLVACKETKPAPDDRCERGVNHVMRLMAADAKAHDAAPSADEQAAIDAVGKASIGTCQTEGLSQEQLDCLLKAPDWAAFQLVAACPAIQAKRPSWLKI